MPDTSPTLTDPEASADWGPQTSGGHRRPWRWIVLVALAALLLSVAAPVGAALTTLDRADVTALNGSPTGGPTHILVVGSDSRDALSDDQVAELGTGRVEGLRTDTIFILSTDAGRAAILALPRDLWVTRCNGTEGRINSAYGLGGPDCLVETVQQTTGIGLDHYVEVDFPGFIDLVGAVGGVEMCLEAPIKDAFAAIDLPAGCQVLSGRDALGFVRVRKIDNDLKRIERQQAFVSALADRILQPSVVMNPFRATAVARAAGAALTVDSGMGPMGLVTLARGGRALASGQHIATTVPVRDTTIGGASVLLALDEAAALYAAFVDGSIFGRIGELEVPQG